MKAKTSVLLSCKSLSSLSASDYKLTTPSALSHEAMLPLNRLIKFDGIVRHGFLLSSILVFKTSRWRERFVFYTSFCVDGYLDRHMAVIPAKGLRFAKRNENLCDDFCVMSSFDSLYHQSAM